jgi:hypothetical protein
VAGINRLPAILMAPADASEVDALLRMVRLFMPAGASIPTVSRAADAVRNAIAQKDITDLFAKSGMTASSSTPPDGRPPRSREGSQILTLARGRG